MLWKRFGGPSAVAQKLGVPWYQPGNWNREGQVPVKFLDRVAEVLKLPVWGLNYKAAKIMLYKEEIPSWENVVKMYNLDTEIETQIIELGEP